MDFNDMSFSKLNIQIGKNLIENKMPESHWLNECMERGAKLVDIAPDEAGAPVDDPLVDAEEPRLLVEQVDPILERHRLPADLDR